MIPEFDEEGRAQVLLADGRAVSILNEERTSYIKRMMSPFLFDYVTDAAAADERSYEVAFLDSYGGNSDRSHVPEGWLIYEDQVRTDFVWRIFGHVPHEVVHRYLDENA